VTDPDAPAVDGRYRLLGSTASPYALKLRGVLRYRRIPFDWVIMGRAGRAETAHLKPMLVPVLQQPHGGDYRNDTTALVRRLEERHPGVRSVVPDHPGIAFVSDLLEDMADEWAVKFLFLYRWSDPADQAYVGRWAAEEWGTSAAPPGSDAEVAEFRDRQIGRMEIIGATDEARALLEESYQRSLDAFEAGAGMDRYLFGSRPSTADFAWYGQLAQLAADPTPMAIMRARAPKTDLWARRLDDASGVDGAWAPQAEALSDTVRALLDLAGAVYLPFLAANSAAYDAGAEWVTLDALGHDFRQRPFKYHVKCLHRLRDTFATLDDTAREAVAPVLAETGCLPFLNGG
jgi:glutathione S-transferase